jgi:hypothetical protein
MNISTNCYIKETDIVTRDIAGETIIVPVRSHVGDLGSIYTLNEIGSLIWQLIDGKNSVEKIVEAICDSYEVTYDEAEKDIIDFLMSLEAAGLIRLSKDERPSKP